jgi:hypothetical protein
MKIELITQQNLDDLKTEIINELKKCFQISENNEIWLKSKEVRKILGCSEGTLVNLRTSGTLPYSKINGTLYYKRSAINNLLNSNFTA